MAQMALKWDATAGPVVSPYSSFLALGTDAPAALKNLRLMAKKGWVGAYGFYESVDYSQPSGQPTIVREWMAHHQGMSLLAVLNLLHDNIVQTWFHANPQIQATELVPSPTPTRKLARRDPALPQQSACGKTRDIPAMNRFRNSPAYRIV